MAKAPVMPIFTDALIGDTTHLSTEQFGCYVLILLATWRNNGRALPDDDRRMARVCRISTQKWRQKMKAILSEMFEVNDSGWHQQRLEKEWDRVKRMLEFKRAIASAGGLARAQARRGNHKPNKENPSSNFESSSARAEETGLVMGPPRAHDTGAWHSVGDVLGMNGHDARCQMHMRYLKARHDAASLELYLNAQMNGQGDDATRMFDLVEEQMTGDGWDDHDGGST